MALSENEELARALGAAAHPLRLDLLEAFIKGLVRSPTEAALTLGEGLPNVLHHIGVLHREGFLARSGPQRSERAVDGRYEATERGCTLVDALAALA